MTTANKTTVNEFCEGFIARLENLVEQKDRGALAMLRRGLGKKVPFESYRFMPFKRKRWQEDAALIIGPLFALWHQGEDKPQSAREGKNLGASMLALVDKMGKEGVPREDAMKRVERRFSALLNSHADDLKPHLRHAVSQLKAKDVAIDWRLLLRDVQQWGHEDRWVQRTWASSFWAPRTEGGESSPEDVADETLGQSNANGTVE
ncbi:MAG: type I-E CRISPR-associated protein Cse2/CasB [Planctomycetes bacterium]|nr:type I-E CRISPR-associated protein Cse2/CasB [Planctomycetota bacterium]